EPGQAGQRAEHAPVHFVARDADSVLLLEGDHELEGVDGIEAEPGSEQGLVVGDPLRREAVEVEGRDDQLLEVGPDAVLSHRVQGPPSNVRLPAGVRVRTRPGAWPCPRTRRRCAYGRRWAARVAGRPGRRRG